MNDLVMLERPGRGADGAQLCTHLAGQLLWSPGFEGVLLRWRGVWVFVCGDVRMRACEPACAGSAGAEVGLSSGQLCMKGWCMMGETADFRSHLSWPEPETENE